MPVPFQTDEAFAHSLDGTDALAAYRRRFHVPRDAHGNEMVYFAGNSLGLQPRGVAEALRRELEDWSSLAVDAHFEGRTPWFSYHEVVRDPTARIVGAHADEVVVMNSLTVNLHLMMVSLYRPTPGRHKILMEDTAFPSDTYAVESQLRHHGFDPDEALIVARAPDGSTIPASEFERILAERGGEIALLLLGGVNYYTGQAFEMKRLAECARRQGCIVGLDLAHAAGNVPLKLHDWNVDFAVWCSYKYLNAGPGAVAGCFVHRRHARRVELPRFAGWWGNDPATRFRMHLEGRFKPLPTADGWQLSNPPILALAPLKVSLELFDRAGMEALRAKSERLTAYLELWVERAAGERVEVLTPREPASRGCQISLRVLERPRELFSALKSAGVVGDYRPPDVVRVAPVPLYNSFHDVWRFGQALTAWASSPPLK